MSIRVMDRVRGLLVVAAFLSCALATPATGRTEDGRQDPAAVVSVVRAHRAVSTTSEAAQAAFDDGLTLLYAFNPEEARVSFGRAALADPELAIAWWGVAMSYGTNLNTDFRSDAQRSGRQAIAKAQALAAHASPVERALIDAAASRFAYDRASDADRSARAYRDAMYAAAATYAADDDVQTLAAESEMDVHPWSFFNADGTATPGTSGLVALLEAVLARDPEHIGANHYLIHALEEAPHPEDALASAQRLAADRFEPAAEHLIHMPAHTFMRVGMYHEAGLANVRALQAYDAYLAAPHAGHADYFGHDCIFGIDAFMMSGEYARARTLAASCNAGMLATVDLRFGHYEALANDPNLSAMSTGMLAVHDGREAVAEAQLAILRDERDDAGILSAGVLEAALAARRGDSNAEIAALERAAGVQDKEGYSEPPLFWLPLGETLGAAYYRSGRLDAAERTFRATLVRERDDPRALFGLARTLEREGRLADAHAAAERYTYAWRQADTELDMKDL